MAEILKTLDEYTVTDRKKDTFFMIFNKAFNSSNLLNDDTLNYFDKSNIDEKSRDEFIEFMKENFPNTKLTKVFDMLPAGVMEYPYLGTIALDCEENDDAYKAICEKYEDDEGNPKSMNAVFWVIKYDVALKNYNEVKEFWKDELEEY
jgi:hypothetical protein